MAESSTSSLIPKAGQIEVPNPPDITAAQFLKQVIENVNLQMAQLDQEVSKASSGDNGLVSSFSYYSVMSALFNRSTLSAQARALYDSLHEVKSRAEQADMILTQIIADPADAANAKLGGAAVTFKNTKKLISAVDELEKELREGEYDYYRAVAELLTEAQAQMALFQQYVALPHIALIKKKIEAIESELRRQIQWSFREIGQLTSSEHYEHEEENVVSDWNVDVSPLSDVCQAIDAL
eukprot:gene37165-45107_t